MVLPAGLQGLRPWERASKTDWGAAQLEEGFKASQTLAPTHWYLYICKYIMRMQPAETSHFAQEVPLGQRHKPSCRMELELAQGSSCQGEWGEGGLWEIVCPSLWAWATGASKASEATTDGWCHPGSTPAAIKSIESLSWISDGSELEPRVRFSLGSPGSVICTHGSHWPQ